MNPSPERRATPPASSVSAKAPAPSDTRTRAENALSQELLRFSRLQHVLKARMSAWAPEGLDYAAVGVLMTLINRGALRQGELADAALLDPSTVSRHVGQLVRGGLVERRPDPADGRAVQLVATSSGRALGAELFHRRQALIQGVLTSWDQDDVYRLVGLLSRLNDDFEGQRQLMTCEPHSPGATALTANALRTGPDEPGPLEHHPPPAPHGRSRAGAVSLSTIQNYPTASPIEQES